jgi:basic amino acid/polyamine antiporter, APA family
MSKTLERSLGFWSVFSISIGAMIGPGLFVLPSLAAGKAGPAVVVVYFLAGLIVIPSALSKAELATAIPTTGGTYVYLDRSMGPVVGTIGGLGTWFSLFFKSAFALVGLGAYLTLFVSLPTKYVALALCAGLIWLNITGVKKTAKLQMGILLCVFVTFIIFIARGFGRLEAEFYSPFSTHGWIGVVHATGLVFVSYAGITKIASIVEEVKRPERNVPLAIFSSLGVMMVVYTLVALVLIGTVPLDDLHNDLTPIATSVGVMFGESGRNIAAIIAVLALISMANAGVLSASRFPFAMSRDNLLPAFLKSIHPKFRTPVASVLLTGVIMLLLIAFVDVERLAKLASAFMLLIFGMVNLSVIIFRETNVKWYKPRFRSPGYPWVQLFGMVTSLLLITQMGSWLPIIGVTGITLGGALWYFIYSRKHANRLGSLAQTHERIKQLREANTSVSRRNGPKETLVPFFGKESESEIESRMRIATLFSLPDGVVHPVYFEEVPDETLLEALRDADKEAERFETRFHRAARRIGIRSANPEYGVTLDTLVTHDAKLAIFRAARALEARWILMGWQRKSFWNFLIQIHQHWWMHHSPCNVAQYLHRGSGQIRKIAVIAQPGPHDALIVHVADQLGVVFDAEIVLLYVAESDAPESDIERVKKYHNQLGQLFRRAVDSRIVRAKRRFESAVKQTEDCDLLIIGVPTEERLLRIFSKSFEDKLAEMVRCSVFQVQSPRAHSHDVTTAVSEAIQTEQFRLSPFLHAGLIEAKVDVKGKAALFSHISKQFVEFLQREIPRSSGKVIPTLDALEGAFWKREQMQTTAIGDGISMPHAVIAELNQTLFGVFTLLKPIDFASPDKSLVDICIVTVGPDDQRLTHLKLLGRIAHLIRATDLLDQLRAAESDTQLADAITTGDRLLTDETMSN